MNASLDLQIRLLEVFREVAQTQLHADSWTPAPQDIAKLILTFLLDMTALQRKARRRFIEAEIALTDRLISKLILLQRR